MFQKLSLLYHRFDDLVITSKIKSDSGSNLSTSNYLTLNVSQHVIVRPSMPIVKTSTTQSGFRNYLQPLPDHSIDGYSRNDVPLVISEQSLEGIFVR
jgi:hypothetical protein